MVSNSSTFHAYGIAIALADGSTIVLNAGANITIQPSGNLITFAAQIPSNVVFNNTTAYQPPSLADADAPKNSIYFSTTASKLVYKAADSSVHALY